MKAVIDAAKSSEDKHGSIPTQLEDCRALAERAGWEVIGEFTDEAFSAYHGNRGPALARAKALAVQLAAEHGRAVLVAQDADRFARGAGDERGAADHLGELYFAMRRQGVALWSVRSGELDLLRAALEGERATGESARKSQAVTAGLKRRAERGQPVGAVPVGYGVQSTVVAGQVVTGRVIDPAGAAVVERIFALAAAGHTPGDISRLLNTEGLVTKRGHPWSTRAVRTVIENRDYLGENGYPALIEAAVWNRAQRPKRTWSTSTPRPPADDFVLGGMVVCFDCGAALAAGVERQAHVSLLERDGGPQLLYHEQAGASRGRGARADRERCRLPADA